jgi:hypothetical protein
MTVTILCFSKVILCGESLVLVVKGEDSQLSGCGFESLCRILDGVSEASYYIEKREIKVAKWGTKLKKKKKLFCIALQTLEARLTHAYKIAN